MNIEELRIYCLQKKMVTESFPFDSETLVFKVLGKMFLLIGIDNPTQFNVKCDPEEALRLREIYSEIQPGYHMNKKLWNTVFMDGAIPEKLLWKFIDDSYDLVIAGMTKKQRELIEK